MDDWESHKLLVLNKLESLEETILRLANALDQHTKNEAVEFASIRSAMAQDRLELASFMSTMKQHVKHDSAKLTRLADTVEAQQLKVNELSTRMKIYLGIGVIISGPLWAFVLHTIFKT